MANLSATMQQPTAHADSKPHLHVKLHPATAIIFIGLLAGGVLCARCRPGKRHVVSMSDKALRLLRQFAQGSPVAEPLDRRAMGELRGVLNQYLVHLLGHRPKLSSYLGILSGS